MQLHVETGVERQQPRLVEFDPCLEERAILARNNHADIDELLALDARDDADYRIVIGRLIAHGSPPAQMRAALAAGA